MLVLLADVAIYEHAAGTLLDWLQLYLVADWLGLYLLGWREEVLITYKYLRPLEYQRRLLPFVILICTLRIHPI